MIGLVWARWVTLHLLAGPWIWLGGLLAAGFWALAATLGPLGINTSGPFLARAHYELAFMGALLGSAWTTHALSRLEGLLERAPALRRLRIRALCLALGGVIGMASTAGLPLAAGSPLGPGDLLLPGALTLLHLGGLALFMLETPLSGAGRSLALACAAWLAPAVLEGHGGPMEVLARLLDAGRPLQSAHLDAGAQIGAALTPILAWILAATLTTLSRPGSPLSGLHALRHPR